MTRIRCGFRHKSRLVPVDDLARKRIKTMAARIGSYVANFLQMQNSSFSGVLEDFDCPGLIARSGGFSERSTVTELQIREKKSVYILLFSRSDTGDHDQPLVSGSFLGGFSST